MTAAPRRAAAFGLAAMAALAMVDGCTPARSDNVVLAIANTGTAALRCLVVFGHWVTADVPVLAPGATASVAVIRDAADRSLHVRREPDGRAMMVEDIVCDRDAAWGRALRHLRLDVVRLGDGSRYATRCGDAGCAPWTPVAL
ncbi:MAG: hypothetical protein ACREER_12465 [Alphaproteobacteria bacterium]